MRLIDADELIERAWRERLDTRECIVQMIKNAPTIKELPTYIPIQAISPIKPNNFVVDCEKGTLHLNGNTINDLHCHATTEVIIDEPKEIKHE